MDHLKELQTLTADACDALQAATDILADQSLPVDARIKAYDRCIEAFNRIIEKIPDKANLAMAQESARNSLIGYGLGHPEIK